MSRSGSTFKSLIVQGGWNFSTNQTACTCLSKFQTFLHIFFVSFLQGTPTKIMTTCKIILTPTNKEQKNCHALATTSAFNLKLCHMKTPCIPFIAYKQQ